ncbi:hypothetical protein FRC06_005391, partial [Ceratobasidium sp. 370]
MADDWNEQQNTLPHGTMYGRILLASDSTQLLTHSGDVAAHAVYLSLANIDKATWASTHKNAWILVAYIPKSKFNHTMAKLESQPKAMRTKLLGVLNHCLFHRCMEVITRVLCRTEPHDVVDPEGNTRSVLYGLLAYIADLEEQWVIAALGKVMCPHCACDPNHLGDPECSPPRSPADILCIIKQIKQNYRAAWGRSPSLEEFTDLAGEYHLNGVDKPFWKRLPRLNIFEALSPDLLHGFHKLFHDHIFKFNRTGTGHDEHDTRLDSQIRFAGDRNFLHGISHISQMTGIEHWMLERTHLPIIANAPGVINAKAYEAAYNDFMANRQAWIENETRRGKHGVIPHFNIPKMHVTCHFVPHVQRKGSADNFSTETMEHLHVGVKEAYQASNHQEWQQQTVRWLTQREKVRDFEAWMEWCELEDRNESEKGNLTEEGDKLGLGGGLDPKDDSDCLSVNAPVAEEDQGSDEALEAEHGEWEEYEDPEEYGERLVDEEDGQEEVGEFVSTNKVCGWLKDQVGSGSGSGSGSVSGEGSWKQKQKRRDDLDEPRHPRGRPHPRLPATHGLTDLQKVNKEPSTRRNAIQEVCKRYHLDVDQLMLEVRRNTYLMNLPVFVDEHTEIDTWDVL